MKITFYRISVLLRQQKRIGIRNFSTSGAFCRNAHAVAHRTRNTVIVGRLKSTLQGYYYYYYYYYYY